MQKKSKTNSKKEMVITMRTMEVVTYDPNWKTMFEAEEKILKSILSDEIIKIEHFGSTSIEGLSAKPIIDIMALVKNIEQIERVHKIGSGR